MINHSTLRMHTNRCLLQSSLENWTTNKRLNLKQNRAVILDRVVLMLNCVNAQLFKTERMGKVLVFNYFLLCFYSPHALDKKSKIKRQKSQSIGRVNKQEVQKQATENKADPWNTKENNQGML
jgi:hypothetical protein